MHRLIIYLLIIVCVVFSGCSGLLPEKSYDKASEKLLKLRTYTCDVEMKVTNNRSTLEYRMKHSYMSPDKYRIEVLEPMELRGQVTIHNSKGSYIYHPRINQYLITQNFSSSLEHGAFIGSFIDHMRNKEKVKVSREEDGGRVFFVLEFELSKPNRYRSMEKIWIDAEDIVPIKAEIYGEGGEKTVSVYYSNFVYNTKLDERDFEIPEN
jgi:outer membrane lipoprotein-sorting protein